MTRRIAVVAAVVGFSAGHVGADEDHLRAGPAAVPCSDLAALRSDGDEAADAVLWSEGYWTAFNLVLADNCFERRDLTALHADRAASWEALRAFCERFPEHDLQAAAYGVMMRQPEADAEPKPQCR